MRYATKAAFTRAVEMAREHGIEIGGFELKPDGGILIHSPGSAELNAKVESTYDRLKREGKL